MTPPSPAQASAIARFKELHASGCFVIPNPWDIGSAVYLEHLGFEALATTSAGFAFSRGLPDEVKALPLELVLGHVRDIAGATRLPVNADFQSGYAQTLHDLAENVALCVATGVAGLSIEDATGDPNAPLYDRARALERIRTARAAIDESGRGVLLTARCEAYLVGDPAPFEVALDRLTAFAAEGADVLYAPGVQDPAEIEAMVRAVAPKPVNVLLHKPSAVLSVRRLAELGVRRVSVGSALARYAWGGFIAAARCLKERGAFDPAAEVASFAALGAIFGNAD